MKRLTFLIAFRRVTARVVLKGEVEEGKVERFAATEKRMARISVERMALISI